MKKILSGILVLLIMMFTISCTGGVSQEDYNQVKSELTAAQSQLQTLESYLEASDDKIIKALAYAVALDLWKDGSRQHYGFEPKYEFETEEERGQAIDEAINDAIDAGQDVELREAWQTYSELMQLYTEETQGMSEEEQIAYWEEHQAEYIPLYATVEFCLSEGIFSALK